MRRRATIRKTVILGAMLATLAGFAYLYRQPLMKWIGFDRSGDRVMAAGQHADAAAGRGERKVLYWVDPMHPAYKSDRPGTAPDCGMDLVPVYADESPAAENLPPGAVKISPQKLQLIGVQYGEVSYQPLSKTIRTVGRVSYDETKIARIHTKIDGWLEQVFVDFTGKLVEKNQPLVSVYSPELLATQQEFLIAKKARDYLSDSPIKETADSSLSLYEAARERLRLWDITDEEIKELEERGKPTRTMTLYAPIAGYVLTRNAFPKQRVTPETELYTLADLSTVWILADIYEYEAPLVRLGQTAAMTLAYYPGKTFTGKVSYIYPQLDNTTRTLKVRLEFPNADLELKPDMYADVALRIDYGTQLSVPTEAVLDSGTEQIVFVALEGGYFEPRKVQLGARVDGRWIVLSGLKRGEKIVTSGNFLIDSESRLKSAMGAMAGMPGMDQAGRAPAGEQKAQPPAQPRPKGPAGQPKHQHNP